MTTDIRYTLRLLTRSPIFTLTSMLSLTINIAASATIFSLADAFLLRTRVNVANPTTLINIDRSAPNSQNFDNFDYPLFKEMHERNTHFIALATYQFKPKVMSLDTTQASERVFTKLVSDNFFEVVETHPNAERFFLPDKDSTPNTHPVVVLSHEFWRRRFTAKPNVLNQSIHLNNHPYTMINVAEAGFTDSTIISPDFWVPIAIEMHVHSRNRSTLTMHNSVWITTINHLKPSTTARQTREKLQSIMHAYLTEQDNDRVSR